MLDMVSILLLWHLIRIIIDSTLDKPDELLESDSKYSSGHNPVMGSEAAANK